MFTEQLYNSYSRCVSTFQCPTDK